MAVKDKGGRVRLSIEIEAELHRKVKIAATERDMTIKDYVVEILESVAEEESRGRGNEDLARLSAAAFARDWDSEEDSVYDDIR